MFIFGSSCIALTLPAVILSETYSPVQSLADDTVTHTHKRHGSSEVSELKRRLKDADEGSKSQPLKLFSSVTL